jgi:hypothetical protein
LQGIRHKKHNKKKWKIYQSGVVDVEVAQFMAYPIYSDRKHTTTNNNLGKAFIIGDVLKGKNGINKTYGYGYGYIVGNTIESDGTGTALTWANNQGSTSGNMNFNKSDKTVAIF